MVNDFLHIGVIQTSVSAETAWADDGSGRWEECVRMSAVEERHAKKEIRHFLSSLRGSEHQPDIILLPELAVPLGFQSRLKRAAEKLETIIIAGLDYRIERGEAQPTVSNEAIIVVPRRLRGRQVARRTEIRRVGKTYAAPGEVKKLSAISGGGVSFLAHPTVWIFDGDGIGKFAVAICYDFMDLDRIVMYRNQIQTLFILAYNRDTTSFDHLAEALSRMLFCNVIICNCGEFGGSLAVSPFREPFRRSIYRHAGQRLPNAQIIQLPLASLALHQSGIANGEFKSLPPGFSEYTALALAKGNL